MGKEGKKEKMTSNTDPFYVGPPDSGPPGKNQKFGGETQKRGLLLKVLFPGFFGWGDFNSMTN